MLDRLNIKNSTVRVCLIICFAAVLWTANLNYDSLWLDEAVSVQRANLEFGELISTISGVGTNPPLHYVLLYGWIRLFGDSEFSVRLPSVLCALASIFFAYKIGVRLFNPRISELAILMVVCSRFQFYFAQEARPYTLFAMLSLCSLYVFYQMLTMPKWQYVLAYIISSSLMLYSHPYAPFIIILQNSYVVFLWLSKSNNGLLDWKHWFALQGIILLIFSPWLLIMSRKVIQIQTVSVSITEPFWVDIPGVFKAHAGDNAILGFAMILLATLAVFSCFQWCQTSVSLKKLWRVESNLKQRREIGFLVLWILIPIVIPFIISKLSAPIFKSHYTLIVLYAFFILVAKGVYDLKHHMLRTAIAIILLLGLLTSFIPAYVQINKEQWRDVASYVEANALPGEPIIFCARYCRIPYNYYNTREDLVQYGIPYKGPAQSVGSESLDYLSLRLRGKKRMWLIFSHSKNEEKVMQYFQSYYDLTKVVDFYRIKVCLLTLQEN